MSEEEVTDQNLFAAADSKSGVLQRVAYSLWHKHKAEEQLPTSGRFLFYEAEQAGFVSKATAPRTDGKKGRRADQDFGEALLHLREFGLIPWADIVDESRQLHSWSYALTIAKYLTDSLEFARLDPWVYRNGFGMCPAPMIIAEAKTVGGVFARTIGPEYLVPVVPTSGQCKGFLINEVVPLLKQRYSAVLYCGDADDAGGDIEDNTRAVLERHAFGRFTWERVAITEEQADDLKARGVQPIEKRDKRYKDGRTHLAFEAEALGQGYLTKVFTDKLDALLPEPLKRVLERERAERKALAQYLAKFHQRNGKRRK
jgi:hypothetical protein